MRDTVATSASSPALVVTLVCIAHFFSHFLMMLLPPLFPVITAELSISYTSVGFAMTVFSLVSAVAQTPLGFAVDRLGAGRLLIAGLAIEGLAFGLIGTATGLPMLVALLALAGVAHAVYHPADYTILNTVVQEQRIGRAFSYHTASGVLGEALAPAAILLLTAVFGWRQALWWCGAASIGCSTLLYANRFRFGAAVTTAAPATAQSARVRLLLTRPLLLGLLFFFGISVVNRGITGFSVSALHLGQSLPLGIAGLMLEAWLIAAPMGVLAGGRIAELTDRHTDVVMACFVIMTATALSLAAFKLSIVFQVGLFAVGGFAAGVVSPSRDMLIRAMTPPGQSGKVFGFVSTGFNLGGMLAPPLYGYLLDQGWFSGIFWVAAMASGLTILTLSRSRRLTR